jgi:hypothetical protein
MQILKLFVTLFLNILRFSRFKVVFEATLIKIILKNYFTFVIGSQMLLKVTKILRICLRNFCEFQPWCL